MSENVKSLQEMRLHADKKPYGRVAWLLAEFDELVERHQMIRDELDTLKVKYTEVFNECEHHKSLGAQDRFLRQVEADVVRGKP